MIYSSYYVEFCYGKKNLNAKFKIDRMIITCQKKNGRSGGQEGETFI